MKQNLHQLIAENDLDAIREIAARDRRAVHSIDEAGLPPLYTARLYRNQRAIDLLLQLGAKVDIFASAYLGQLNRTRTILKDDQDAARVTTLTGMTALHFAARAGEYDVAEVLLQSGADPNARDKDNCTPLLEASHGGPWKQSTSDEIIRLLLKYGASVDLFAAAAMGRPDLLRSLLDENPTAINDTNSNHHTAVYLAAANGHLDAVKLLVESGADVNLADAVGTAALHRTSQQCSDKLIQYLIANGAKAHLCCHVACGNESGIRQALKNDPDAVDEILYEFNAVGYAIHCWQPAALCILLEHGGRLTAEDQQHILRITENNQPLLDRLLRIQNK